MTLERVTRPSKKFWRSPLESAACFPNSSAVGSSGIPAHGRMTVRCLDNERSDPMFIKKLTSAAVASLVLSSAALAATETGNIKTLDTAKKEFVLDTGKTFEAPVVKLDTFKVGDRVMVEYDTKDGKMIASKVETAK